MVYNKYSIYILIIFCFIKNTHANNTTIFYEEFSKKKVTSDIIDSYAFTNDNKENLYAYKIYSGTFTKILAHSPLPLKTICYKSNKNYIIDFFSDGEPSPGSSVTILPDSPESRKIVTLPSLPTEYNTLYHSGILIPDNLKYLFSITLTNDGEAVKIYVYNVIINIYDTGCFLLTKKEEPSSYRCEQFLICQTPPSLDTRASQFPDVSKETALSLDENGVDGLHILPNGDLILTILFTDSLTFRDTVITGATPDDKSPWNVAVLRLKRDFTLVWHVVFGPLQYTSDNNMLFSGMTANGDIAVGLTCGGSVNYVKNGAERDTLSFPAISPLKRMLSTESQTLLVVISTEGKVRRHDILCEGGLWVNNFYSLDECHMLLQGITTWMTMRNSEGKWTDIEEDQLFSCILNIGNDN